MHKLNEKKNNTLFELIFHSNDAAALRVYIYVTNVCVGGNIVPTALIYVIYRDKMTWFYFEDTIILI